MPNWRLIVFLERIVSCLPYRHKLNQVLQIVRYGLRIGSPGRVQNMRNRIPDVCRRLHDLGRHMPLEGSAVCDVGTGFGLPAILLYLAGAGSILTIDAVRQVTFGYLRRLLQVLREEIAICAESLGVSARVIDRRLAAVELAAGLDDLFRETRIAYQAPKDATVTGLPSGSIDLYYAFHVLEYVPLDVLHALCREARRVLKPSGRFYAMSRCMSDYAAIDKNLHPLHYLSFSDEEWTRVSGSRMKHLNRLREQEYIEVFQQHGATILDVEHDLRSEDVDRVRKMPLAARFARLTPEQNAVRRTQIILSFAP
jgi:SAM-dependent methyltransferase